MSSDVLQFQCSACQNVLTVPSHMAGVTGPCPICGQTVTSPSAAPPAASVSLFTTPAPAQPSYRPTQEPESAAPPSLHSAPGQGLVMPMPNSIAQHLNPLGAGNGSTSGGGLLPQTPSGFPSSPIGNGFPGAPQQLGEFNPPPQNPGFPSPSAIPGFLNGPPASPQEQPPPWQQPGLGQTLLGGIPSATGMPGSMGFGGGGLPPKRNEGSAPLTGSLPQPMAAWGGQPAQQPQELNQPANTGGNPSFPSPRASGSGAPSHSNLIPGSPTLPTLGSMGMGDSSPQSSLLSREVPTAAPTPAAIPEPRRDFATPPARPARPIKKPSRSSNVFMFALAVLFLVGFLAAAGWMFREPIMELVHRYMPPKDDVPETPAVVMPMAKPESSESSKVTVTEAPPVEIPVEPAPKPAFDPGETAPPKAMAPSPAEMAALNQSTPMSPGESPALTEVPSKALTPSLQNDAAPSTTQSVLAPSTAEVQMKVSEEAKPAAEALLKFLNAKDMKERMRYTLAASSMKPLMEMYYKAQPDGPIRVDTIGLIRLDPKPQMGSGAHALFGVESRTWEFPVPVMLEETKDGFQVDWLSFVEFKDRLLEKFFEGYQEGAARFHVGITRVHDFEYKVPNSENKDAFRISPSPPNPYLNTVFVEKDSQIGRELKDRIPWGAHVWAIVELEWVKLGSQQWVQLVGVPQLNWYSVPAEPKGKSGKNSTDLPNEVQRAVPVGR